MIRFIIYRKEALILITLALFLLGPGCRSSRATERASAADSTTLFLPGFPNPSHWTYSSDGAFLPLVSAHRGRPELDDYPENCIESLQKLFSSGSFIAEIDVARSRDGVLFLFHDDHLNRLTLHTGPTSARDWSDLDTMRLRAPDGRLTEFTIPTLEEALRSAKGRGLVALDRKTGVSLAELTEVAADADMLPHIQLILYDEDDYREWAELDRIGAISHEASSTQQLEELAQRNRELYARFAISPFRENRSRPAAGFIGVGEPPIEILRIANTLGIRAAIGTFGELDSVATADNGATYRELVRKGVSIIATDRPLAAARAVYPTAVARPPAAPKS